MSTKSSFNAILIDPYAATIEEISIPFCEEFVEINKILHCKRNFAYGLKVGTRYSLGMRVSDEPESESKGFVYHTDNISEARFINGRALLIAYDQESGLEIDIDSVYDNVNVESLSGQSIGVFSTFPPKSLAQAIDEMEYENFFSPEIFVAFSTRNEFESLKERLSEL